MSYESWGQKMAMTKAAQSQKHALECLRLANDCTQMAGAVLDPALQLHFTRMAQVWNGLAEVGLAEQAPANRLDAISAA